MKLFSTIVLFVFFSTTFLLVSCLLAFNFLKPQKTAFENIQIYSHRGFNLQKTSLVELPPNPNSRLSGRGNAGTYKVNAENTVDSLSSSLKTYDGVEFDLHEIEAKDKGQKELVLLHDDYLELFDLPNVYFSNFIYDKNKLPKLNKKVIEEKLKRSFAVDSLEIKNADSHLETFDELTKKLKKQNLRNKLLFAELKTGGKQAFGFYGYTQPFLTTDKILEANLQKNSAVISFYFWTPLVAKIKALTEGKYLQTGNLVVGVNSSKHNVLLAKLFGYDFFMPPHDQINREIMIECRKQGLTLVTWSRGSVNKENKSIKKLLKIYNSIEKNQRPKLGLIVNQNYSQIRSLVK